MLLRASFSNTKKFFKKSIESFKSYFSGGYQRLPKDQPPCHPTFSSGRDAATAHINTTSHSYRELENIYSEFIDRWEGVDTRKASTPSPVETGNLKLKKEASLINRYEVDRRTRQEMRKRVGSNRGKDKEAAALVREREEKNCFVTRKLKELEMMDKDNVDHVFDIKEVLHYYSRLTCPVYRDIIEKFFMEIYSELFNQSSVDNSMTKRRMVQI